jgi:DNA-binding response OmpR family regulator
VRILLVEDNSSLAKLIMVNLQKFYAIDLASTLLRARFCLDTKDYQAIILDLDLIGQDYAKFCHDLKQTKNNLVILLLSTQFNLSEKISCLKKGADYLIKPFNLLELMAKLRWHLYKMAINQPKLSTLNLELDQLNHQVYLDDRSIYLNRKEYALLEVFLTHQNQVLSKAALAEQVWQEEQVLMSNTIASTIAHLRKKIGKNVIKTIKGVGYAIR